VTRPSNAPPLNPALPCREWDGELDRDGYGRWGNGSAGSQQAHRRVWEEDVGDIPEGMTLDHLCRNRACIRLEHLDLVTMSENSKRRWAHSRRSIIA
jgi:hypothetical protein